MIANTAQVRGHLVTLDYSDDDASALLLARPRGPAPLDKHGVNHLIEPVLIRERRKHRIDVPRMSMLIRFEEEHERRLRRVQRQFVFLLAGLMGAFAVGLVAGVSIRPPTALQPAVTSARNAAAHALSAVVAATESRWQGMLGEER